MLIAAPYEKCQATLMRQYDLLALLECLSCSFNERQNECNRFIRCFLLFRQSLEILHIDQVNVHAHDRYLFKLLQCTLPFELRHTEPPFLKVQVRCLFGYLCAAVPQTLIN